MDYSAMKTYETGGISFLVDTEHMVLREKENPENFIHKDNMLDEGSHYSFYYLGSDKNVLSVSVPQFVHLDPDGMRWRYSMSRDEPLPGRDADFKCNPELLKRRIEQGVLPVIDIHGWKYIVDARLNELRPEKMNIHWRPVSFDDLSATDLGYRIVLDSRTGAIVLDEEIMPKENLIIAEIPDRTTLDPVGEARLWKVDDLRFVNDYPVRDNFKARIIIAPLEKKKLPQTKRVKVNPTRKSSRKRN